MDNLGKPTVLFLLHFRSTLTNTKRDGSEEGLAIRTLENLDLQTVVPMCVKEDRGAESATVGSPQDSTPGAIAFVGQGTLQPNSVTPPYGWVSNLPIESQRGRDTPRSLWPPLRDWPNPGDAPPSECRAKSPKTSTNMRPSVHRSRHDY